MPALTRCLLDNLGHGLLHHAANRFHRARYLLFHPLLLAGQA
jgi:hypothetical protein